MADIEFLNPEGLFDARPIGFSHVSIAPAGRIIHVAGQTAIGSDGRFDDDDLTVQTRKALTNLGVALAASGAASGDLVALRVYVVNLQRSMFARVAPEIARFVGDVEPPPATWIGVTSLLSSRALIEIEGVAVA